MTWPSIEWRGTGWAVWVTHSSSRLTERPKSATFAHVRSLLRRMFVPFTSPATNGVKLSRCNHNSTRTNMHTKTKSMQQLSRQLGMRANFCRPSASSFFEPADGIGEVGMMGG